MFKVIVSEPTTEEAVTILRGIRERYEQHHRVWIMDQAIVTAATLAHRYFTARRYASSFHRDALRLTLSC